METQLVDDIVDGIIKFLAYAFSIFDVFGIRFLFLCSIWMMAW